MARYELKLPSMGESVAEAVVTNWLKKVGDPIEAEEAIVEVATDKVDSEVPSEVSGIVSEILFKVDEVVKIGQVMAIIETQETADASAPPQQTAEILMQNISDIKETTLSPQIDFSSAERFYSPLVKNIAKQEGISLDELAHIEGTGLNNRVTKDDILAYIAHRTQPTNAASTPAAPATATSIDQRSYTKHGEERIEMSRMGKIIAEHMTLSKQTSAHVQSFTEVDVTRIWQWRNKVKKAFEANEGEKFTFTPIFIEAVAKALIDFPMMNISVEGTTIIKKKKHMYLAYRGLEQAYEEGKIGERGYRVYQRYLKSMEKNIKRNFASRLTYYFLVSIRILRFLLHELLTFGKTFRSWKDKEKQRLLAIDYDQIAALYLANTEIIIESLEDLKGVYRSSLISYLQESRLRETAIITSGAFVERVINRVKPNNIDEMLRGYYLERKIIFEYEAQHLITAKQARRMRQNVNELESYSLRESANTLPYDMIEYARNR